MRKTFNDKLILGEKLSCPICGKEYKVNADTCYIAGGGYVCSWKCFLKRVTGREIQEQDFQNNNLEQTIPTKKIANKHLNKPDMFGDKLKNNNSQNNISETIVPAKKRGRPRKEKT